MVQQLYPLILHHMSYKTPWGLTQMLMTHVLTAPADCFCSSVTSENSPVETSCSLSISSEVISPYFTPRMEHFRKVMMFWVSVPVWKKGGREEGRRMSRMGLHTPLELESTQFSHSLLRITAHNPQKYVPYLRRCTQSAPAPR